MSKSPPYARIAITIPQQDLAAAERLAKAQDRSRSWIVAEAVRRYVAAAEGAEGEAEVHALNTLTLPSRPGLGASRTLQLERDMALTPEQRVRIAEETLALRAHVGEPRPRAPRGFDSYEAFLDWKHDRDVVP